MSNSKELNKSKVPAGSVDVDDHPLQELLFAGIQAAGGTALAVYTYKNSTNPIWSIAYSAIALGGSCNVFKSVLKVFRKSVCSGRDESSSARNAVTGTIVYFASLYGFSEALKCNTRLWIPCLGTAVSGFYYATSSLNNLKGYSTMDPYLKSCQLAFEPTLILYGTIYLLYFRNHEEEYLYWVPLLITGAIGFNFTFRGFCTDASKEEPEKLLLKAIEIFMGGCLLTISSTMLAIYGSRNEFRPSWKVFMIVTSFLGVFKILASITCLMQYVDMNEEVSSCFGGMISGNILFFSACLMVKYMDHSIKVYIMFLLLAGGGHAILWTSFYDLNHRVPRPLFNKYCQRTLGPMLTVYSSIVSAYVGCHVGWRFSYPFMTFIPAGIYVAYKGFRRSENM